MLRTAATLIFLSAAVAAHAQWRMLESGSTSSFRGIHAVSDKIAWVSGTGGTVLRTMDGGEHWEKCTVPEGAEKLDFRGAWAWSADDAMVMSSGPGDQSRLYATADGCRTWKLVQTNQEKDGFWDGLVFQAGNGVLVGDPVRGRFFIATVTPSGQVNAIAGPCAARGGEAAFAASNSSVFVFGPNKYILGTGGKGGPRALLSPALAKHKDCVGVPVPVAASNESSGVFSLFFRDAKDGVAVGGDYQKPNESGGTAAFTSDGGRHWTVATTPPHGYRSSVAWDSAHQAWIAAGTNGSDISFDDGRTWRELDDGNWNALSLPFAVGPKGRIGRVDESALRPVVNKHP